MATIRELIEIEIAKEEPSLPILEKMLESLNEILEKEDFDPDELAELIEKDPTLSAKILRMANSPVYSGLVKVKTIGKAITRIGTRAVKNFLLTALLKDSLVGEEPDYREMFKLYWESSLGCALVSKRLADHLNLSAFSEDAYMLGLLHSIGAIFIFNTLHKLKYDEDTDIDINENLIREIISTFQASLGAQLLNKMNFDSTICQIVEMHMTPEDYAEKDDPLFNILMTAINLMRKNGTSLDPDPNISIVGLPYVAKLGIDPMYIAVLEVDIEDMIDQIESML